MQSLLQISSVEHGRCDTGGCYHHPLTSRQNWRKTGPWKNLGLNDGHLTQRCLCMPINRRTVWWKFLSVCGACRCNLASFHLNRGTKKLVNICRKWEKNGVEPWCIVKIYTEEPSQLEVVSNHLGLHRAKINYYPAGGRDAGLLEDTGGSHSS
jgi:hypothetical protein